MAGGATQMARVKSKVKAKPLAAPATAPGNKTVINMKGTAGYIDWLEGVHRETHIPKAQIVRLALAEWASKHGHDAPPEI